MSTVRLKKEYGNSKAGDTVSVPFLVGRQLVADGAAEYPPPEPRPAKGRRAVVREVTVPPKADAPPARPPARDVVTPPEGPAPAKHPAADHRGKDK
jgi:hypothetical protein